MTAASSHRLLLALAALAAYASVTAAFIFFERPGLGIGHLFYVPIALLALSGNAWIGGVGGALAVVLYSVAVIVNPNFPPSDLLEASTAIRAATYIFTGALIGSFAHRNRALVDRLRRLASRDYLTDLPNVRAFEEELHRRCAGARRFALLLADLDGLKDVNDRDGHAEGNLLLRRVAAALGELTHGDDVVARIGGDEFAILTEITDAEEVIMLCRRLENEFEGRRIALSFGWALHPVDGKLPVSLFRRADERLHSSKEQRKSRQTVATLLAGARRA